MRISPSTRFNFKAATLGALLDIVGSIVAFSILHVTLASRVRVGAPSILLQDAVGLLFSFLGGLAAARLARGREFIHSAASAVPCVLLGLVVPMEGSSSPTWHLAVSHSGLLFALLGGYCARGWNRAGSV